MVIFLFNRKVVYGKILLREEEFTEKPEIPAVWADVLQEEGQGRDCSQGEEISEWISKNNVIAAGTLVEKNGNSTIKVSGSIKV